MATATKTPDVIRIDAEELGSIIEELQSITEAAYRIGDLTEAKVKVNGHAHDLVLVYDGRCWFIEVPVP